MATLAQTILSAKADSAGAPAPVASDSDVAADVAAEEVLSAFEKKDKAALRRALKNLRIIDSED